MIVFVAGGFLLPCTSHAERAVTIARPPAEVFAMFDSCRRFNTWSPWHACDPKAVYIFEAPRRGVCAAVRWPSEQSDVGKERQSIIGSSPVRKIVTRLEFEGHGDAIGTFTLAPDGDGTHVVWSFDAGHGMNPLSRWFGLLFDRMIGPDFEHGLARLNGVLEAEPQ